MNPRKSPKSSLSGRTEGKSFSFKDISSGIVERISFGVDSIPTFGLEFGRPRTKEDSVKDNPYLKDLAILSADVYGKIPLELPKGCVLCRELKTDSDLHAKLYRLGSGHYVCAFAGTVSIKDNIHNVLQGVGLSCQYNDALEFAKDVIHDYSSDVIFTGHSQGGGEAAYCAFSLGKRACTFNPAGLSMFTYLKSDSSHIKEANVQSYIFGMDLLDLFQKFISYRYPLFNIGPDGNVHKVSDYTPKKLSISHLHGMEGILYYFGVLS